MTKAKGNLLLFVAAAFGGFGFVAMKALLDSGFSPMQCVAGRYIVTVVFMWLFYFKQFKKITKNELKGGVIMGVLLFLLFLFLMEGLKRTTPSINAFLSCTTSVMVPIILWVAYKKKPDKYVVIGAGMTFVGVALLSLTDGLEISLGAVLSLCASVVFAAQMVIMDKYVASGDPARLTLIESLVVMVLALAVVAFSKEAVPTPSQTDIVMFLVSGVFCTFLYFLFQSIGQKYTSPISTSIIITSEAVFAALASSVFYGESLGLKVISGGTLIFVAVIITEVKPEFSWRRLLTNREK